MRYIEFDEPGGPDVLHIADMPVPDCAAGELLIEVSAAGVNRPDVMQRKGLYPPPADASPVLGLEVAGWVRAIGPGVEGWAVGDRVCALTNGGAYAECVTAPAGQCLPVPAGLSLTEAAGLPETCFTVWTNVFDRSGLQAGECFLVHGGTSGIGTTAIQMAHALGSRVFATAGSDAKCSACVDLGAELAINYREQDFVATLLEATGGLGVDVILDMVGGDYIERNFQVAALGGRIASIAFLGGAKVSVNAGLLLMKRLCWTGSTLRPQSSEAKAGIANQLRERVWPEIEAGRLKTVVAEVFPLEEAAAAHELMESSQHIGKIILQVKD